MSLNVNKALAELRAMDVEALKRDYGHSFLALVGTTHPSDIPGEVRGKSSNEAWAAQRGPTLSLHVHEKNARARGYYAKRGFARTGATYRYVLDPTQREIEMRKTL